MTRLVRLLLIAAGMTAFLVVMLADHLDRRANGTEIRLPVEGYDPRDILLGHYANIRTALQRLDAYALAGEDDFETGDTLFVTLETGPDGLARPVALHHAHPGTGLVAQGRVQHVYEASRPWRQTTDPQTGDMRNVQDGPEELWIQARFNIERYYASRERALSLQTRLRQRGEDGGIGVNLILAVPDDGRLVIKGFEIDGQRRLDSLW